MSIYRTNFNWKEFLDALRWGFHWNCHSRVSHWACRSESRNL